MKQNDSLWTHWTYLITRNPRGSEFSLNCRRVRQESVIIRRSVEWRLKLRYAYVDDGYVDPKFVKNSNSDTYLYKIKLMMKHLQCRLFWRGILITKPTVII